jgi:hypothetical protein
MLLAHAFFLLLQRADSRKISARPHDFGRD